MNPRKALNVIFTYNRPYLLDNCVRSLLRFGPEGDALIVDDGSSLPQARERLANWEGEGLRVFRAERRHEGGVGGLTANMQRAYEWAQQEGYDFLFFIQDDQQFMWKDACFWKRIDHVFSNRGDALHVRPMFEKITARPERRSRFQLIPELDCWLHLKHSFADAGVLSVRKMEEVGWAFQPSERENNQQAKALGLHMFILARPVLAFVPEPHTWHEVRGLHQGEIRAPVREFFLRPLTGDQIKKLDENRARNVAYLEEYCFPWGWKASSPYGLGRDPRRLRKDRWRWIRRNRFLRWPRKLGVP